MMTSLLPAGSIRRFGRCLRIFSISTAGLVLLGSLIGVLGSLVLPSIASATTSVTLYASPDGSGSCTSSSSPCSLSTAISTASGSTYSEDAVTIDLVGGSSGTCTTSTCFDGDFSVSGGSEASLTIEGSGTGSDSSAASVLNGNNSGTTFYDSATFAVTLENVTVTGGNAGFGFGGSGIFSNGDGGGIANRGTLTVTDSTISGNTAIGGGGIYNGGTMTVTDSTISGNTATSAYGGGIYNGYTMTVAYSTISANTASTYGGGIANFGGTMTVADSTISGNTATSGSGGGIYNNSGTMTVADSTISGNTATSAYGGGVANFDGTMTLAGSIVADQTSGGNCNGSVTDAGYNLSNDTSCKFGSPSGSSTSQDSVINLDLATTLANSGGQTETIAILGSSAAAAFISSPATVTLGGISINLCSDTSYTTSSGYKANLSVDQRGVSRPATGCSAGAYQAT